MRNCLVYAILLVSVVAGTLSEIIVFRMVDPPEPMAAVLGGLWVAMPFLAAPGLAALVRRHSAALVVLLIALLLASAVGISMLNASAAGREAAEQRVQDAVQPGEDPHSGPAAKRRAGAEMGAAASGVFSILLVVFLPPVQVAAVLIPTLIGYAISALLGAREERQVPVSV
jgi:hypothetical protein